MREAALAPGLEGVFRAYSDLALARRWDLVPVPGPGGSIAFHTVPQPLPPLWVTGWLRDELGLDEREERRRWYRMVMALDAEDRKLINEGRGRKAGAGKGADADFAVMGAGKAAGADERKAAESRAAAIAAYERRQNDSEVVHGAQGQVYQGRDRYGRLIPVARGSA